MADGIPPNPNPIHSLPPSACPTSDSFAIGARSGLFNLPRRPPIRLTSEYDSEGSLFFHKLSSNLLHGFAKIKFSFQNNYKGDVFCPQMSFITENLSVLYDIESRNTLLRGSLNVGNNLKVRTNYNVQQQLGAISVISSLPNPSLQLELSSAIPSVGRPRASLQFPFGEISVERKESPEQKNEAMSTLSVDGILKSPILNGVCTALYNGKDLNLRYLYKDAKMSFIPTVNMPSNKASFAFKRRFSSSDKLSYWYHFESNAWSAVYKHNISNDLKIKAGYDSELRLGWASLWVGAEGGKSKAAPLKLIAQLMLQLPQDDIRSSALMFRVKKRWDF